MESKTSTNCSIKSDMPSEQILRKSVIDRDLSIIDKILNEDESWKAIDDKGETVLHLAFKNKTKISDEQQKINRILKRFLKKGLSVNIENSAGKTVLFSAIENRLHNVIKFLVKRNADLNVCDESGNSIIHFLIEDQFLNYWEYCGRNESLQFRQILEKSDVDFLTFLLPNGVNIDCKNNAGKTPLQIAVEFNLQHVIPILIKYTKEVQNIEEAGRILIDLFVATTDFRHIIKPPYIYARYFEHRFETDIIQCLLNKGMSVDDIDDMGNSVVHKFLKNYHQNPEMIKSILQRCNKINAQDQDGNTLLLLVINNNKSCTFDLVRILLAKNVNVNMANNNGDTAVRRAILLKNMNLLTILIEYGADLRPSIIGNGLLHHVCIKKDFCDDENFYVPFADRLIRAGHDVNEVVDGNTPLSLACKHTCPFIAQKLIDAGANVHYKEKKNDTNISLIHVAAIGLHQAYNPTGKAVLLKILDEAGADINVKNEKGETVLNTIPRVDSFMIRTLLDLGADLEVSDNENRLPLHKAIRTKKIEDIQALLEFGADVNDTGVLTEMLLIGCDDKFIINKFNQKMDLFDMESRRYDENDNLFATTVLLLEHWIKLKLADFPVLDGFTTYVREDRRTMFKRECLKEIETLKAHRFDSRTSLYDVLHMNVNLKCGYIINIGGFEKLVKSSTKKFPNYNVLIKAIYNRAITRYRLIEPAKKGWFNLTAINLPDICLERVFYYLKNEDLRAIAQDEEEIIYRKRPSNEELSEEPAKKNKIQKMSEDDFNYEVDYTDIIID